MPDADGWRHPDGKPLFVLCRTDPCRGVALLEKRRPKLHYVRFASPAERQAYVELRDAERRAAGGEG